VVLRPVLHGGILGPLFGAALLGLRRPLRELERTARLRDAGAPVPRPAFVVGRRAAGPVFTAAVATVEEAGTLDALAFLQAGPDRGRIARGARAAGRAVRRFHDAGGRHADLHVKNLLLREEAGGPRCLVVDLDRVRVGAAPSPAARMAELMRLYRSLVKRGLVERVGRRGLAAFLGAYAGRDRALRAALLARLPVERRRLALHALRYRWS
jgi:hypothetical protein